MVYNVEELALNNEPVMVYKKKFFYTVIKSLPFLLITILITNTGGTIDFLYLFLVLFGVYMVFNIIRTPYRKIIFKQNEIRLISRIHSKRSKILNIEQIRNITVQISKKIYDGDETSRNKWFLNVFVESQEGSMDDIDFRNFITDFKWKVKEEAVKIYYFCQTYYDVPSNLVEC
ncbi:hypothetical protein NEF87_002164 [Candidatus Lokiarchaeum ossiferum]|uniref:Uncharacterized protein n=1 Tax=Candidatus Lokiarchaeum ossiferum TaxID=2951803 RepID=A0ABY6HQV1_9ARCH|nr:hypothetical protein NEF87_002164 [Candidatus Lokiarchaeum sp. B-35]